MRKRPQITEARYDKWADDLKRWITDSVSPFENDSPGLQKERIKLAKHGLLHFCEIYLPHYFPLPFGELHYEWEEFTEIRDEAAFLAAPREHGKSTFFSFAVPLRNICLQLRMFQMIISDTNDQATGFSLPIRLELEENPRLKHDFGDLRGSIWKSNDFTTSNGVRVLARGKGEKVRGLKNRQYRPDFAVVDDFENDENVENPRLIRKGKTWLKRAVIGSMGAGYTFLMVGNLFHPKSVLSQFIAEKDETGALLYRSKIYRAWVNHGKPNQHPLWPEAWPPERLEKKRRQMGSVDFNAEMINLTGEEGSPFPENNFRYYEQENLIRNLITATFCDPSAKNGESNDYKAVITVGLERNAMQMYVLRAWVRRTGIAEMFDEIYRQQEKYHSMVGIEENMLKDFLHESIENYARESGKWLPWMPVHHRTNKIGRIISTLQYLISYGKLQFCRGDSDQDRVVEQLIYLLNKNVNDDGADALEGAVRLLQEQGGGGAVQYRRVSRRRFGNRRGAF